MGGGSNPVRRTRCPAERRVGQFAPSTAGEQHGQPPSTDPRTASAASQHGPEPLKTWSDRLGRPRCRSSPASRASRAWSPAIRSAISARRSPMRRGSSAVVSAQCPDGTSSRSGRRLRAACRADGGRSAAAGARHRARRSRDRRCLAVTRAAASPSARRSGPCRSRRRPAAPARRSSCAQQTLESFECRPASVAGGRASTCVLEPLQFALPPRRWPHRHHRLEQPPDAVQPDVPPRTSLASASGPIRLEVQRDRQIDGARWTRLPGDPTSRLRLGDLELHVPPERAESAAARADAHPPASQSPRMIRASVTVIHSGCRTMSAAYAQTSCADRAIVCSETDELMLEPPSAR